MKTALIGSTGFVGSNILSQKSFDDLYNSKNIDNIKGKSYKTIICAGAPGTKWIANKYPEEDLKSINHLIENLQHVTATEFILISTVDVYNQPIGVDEETKIEIDSLSPYGKHRLLLENFIKSTFRKFSIIRLPALFGKNLKKNFIFDLINDRMLDYTHPSSSFQFYNLTNIGQDIEVTIKNQVPLINFATEPITAQEIATSLKLNLTPGEDVKVVSYDIHTKYRHLFQSNGVYLYSKDQLLPEVISFIQEEKRKIKP